MASIVFILQTAESDFDYEIGLSMIDSESKMAQSYKAMPHA